MNEPRLWLLCALCALGFLALGILVTRGVHSRLDMAALHWRGAGTRGAIVFTRSGYGPALTGIAIVVAALAYLLHAPMVLAACVLLAQLLSQGAVESYKRVFGRARPELWLYRQERGFSYPSGHSATAVVFFIGFALVLSQAGVAHPLALGAAILLVKWGLGVMWSRMALGAHYASDVLGGALFGAATLCATFVLYKHLPSALH